MVGNINCVLVFSSGVKPGLTTVMNSRNVRVYSGDSSIKAAEDKAESIQASECLVKVYATEDIKAGTELLLNYGPGFFTNEN